MSKIPKLKNVDIRYLVGIDEVGRGPLAGPLAVGAVCVAIDFDWSIFKGIRDSKKLTHRDRVRWSRVFMDIQLQKKNVGSAISFVSPQVIDRKGIRYALQKAIQRSITRLDAPPDQTLVLLDGGLRAPQEYQYQKTIIKGDEKFPVISVASIIAKVARDKRLVRYAERFPEYGFDIHKGYGTKKHRESIKKYGMCDIHRQTFCRNIMS